MKSQVVILALSALFVVGCSSSTRFSSSLASGQLGQYTRGLNHTRTNAYISRMTDNDKNTPTTDSIPSSFRGLASYYGNEFNGRMTSSGELYDQNRFTAAHRTLPFGTFLLVTNLKNNTSVVVRINDRGPFKMERVLDLSQAAAEELDMLRDGVLEVAVHVIE